MDELRGDAKEHEYPFFTNRDCKYFPCHEGVPEDEFNCLFCYCPLYALGARCGGDFTYTSKGVKNCTPCSIPHRGDSGTPLVRARFSELIELAKVNSPSANAQDIADKPAASDGAQPIAVEGEPDADGGLPDGTEEDLL
ncbi:MAG: cysteine-rich small domain-containing protein [Eggerthellaceae bacterium]|nr:cysteine-rich small domain-containing protein [Eggerthellaceae bacterium]